MLEWRRRKEITKLDEETGRDRAHGTEGEETLRYKGPVLDKTLERAEATKGVIPQGESLR